MNAFKAVVLFLIVPFLVLGCAGTQQVSRQLEMKSHFLGPNIVSKLKEGGDDQAKDSMRIFGARSHDKIPRFRGEYLQVQEHR